MSSENRAKYLDKARFATAVANDANERRVAWDMLTKSLLRLMLAYDGNPMKDKIKEWYDAIALEAIHRRQPLCEISDKHREEARKYMDLYDNEEGF